MIKRIMILIRNVMYRNSRLAGWQDGRMAGWQVGKLASFDPRAIYKGKLVIDNKNHLRDRNISFELFIL